MKTYLKILISFALTGLCHAQGFEPPSITSISATASVDVSSGAQIVTATVQVTDNEIGFDYGNLYLYRPDGTFVSSHFMGSTQRTAGDSADGTYDVEMTVPQYAPGGNWEIRAFVQNSDGDMRDYGGSECTTA